MRTVKNAPAPTKYARAKEVVHLPLENALYRAIRTQAETEHRSIINLLQLMAIEGMERRGVKL